MNDTLIEGYQRWRDQQIATRKPGIPFNFCGDTYIVEFTSDERRILIGPSAKVTQEAA